ncbi:hypothetical protein EYF80_039148 [Liparis tanakae]|uniref:Uncharacterized protein n=1 Tax=Liparis tanakae TaxID=230148 RepID=A0A4Z2GBZ6_9TELE|nr:hypothetical protein EYF80_039148 [Liparis tanakae]
MSGVRCVCNVLTDYQKGRSARKYVKQRSLEKDQGCFFAAKVSGSKTSANPSGFSNSKSGVR